MIFTVIFFLSLSFSISLFVNALKIISCMLFIIYLWFVNFCYAKKKIERPIVRDPVNPCVHSPCGPNSQCRVSTANDQAVCSCLPNYIGRSPNCRPECTSNSECRGNMACINQRCQNPCQGSCGSFTTCIVNNHNPICRCIEGYIGDPFSECSPQSKNALVFFKYIRFRILNICFPR